MRLFLSFIVLAFLGLVQALSSSGSRLLVVLEEAAEKALFSTFWADLEGRSASCDK
jgi:oligosaccharyltransferase complex subunit beta